MSFQPIPLAEIPPAALSHEQAIARVLELEAEKATWLKDQGTIGRALKRNGFVSLHSAVASFHAFDRLIADRQAAAG